MKTITFKSTPENWKKEYLGIKPNTIRLCDTDNDVRFEILQSFIDNKWSLINIELQNTETAEVFTREVTDVTYYKGYYIISFRRILNQ